jgi:ATP-dependent Lhr-like helicase
MNLDRGLFGVLSPVGLVESSRRELDEEMVSRAASVTLLLGATTWRIDDITPQRVVVRRLQVNPARCHSGKVMRPDVPEMGRIGEPGGGFKNGCAEAVEL